MLTHLQLALKIHNWRNGVDKAKKSQRKNDNPLRAGVLSAARINWAAFFDPVDTHPDIVVSAVAARSLDKAQAQIDKYKLPNAKAYGSYEELLADKDIDVVYTALPNGLHAEWAIKSMEAGKHILIEKPVASTASEVKRIQECSARTGKIAFEAMHWQYHPAAHAVRQEVESGKHGKVQSLYAKMTLPGGTITPDDIRLRYDLAGGATMDLCYVISCALYFCDPKSTASVEVTKATPRINATDAKIDEAMDVEFIVRDAETDVQIPCTTHCDLAQPKLLGLIPKLWDAYPCCTIELEKSQINVENFAVSHLKHSIVIKAKDASGKLTGQKDTIQCFKDGPKWGRKGEQWWTTYRYQLEAFVNEVRAVEKGQDIKTAQSGWPSLTETEQVMTVIDAVYDKANLPRRVSHGFT